MRILPILMSALAAVAITACSTAPAPNAPQPVRYSDASGGYVGANQWYQTKGGMRYAWDGAAWYVLRSPEFDQGGGVAIPECWQRSNSNMQCYQRTPATYRDQTLRPVFVAY